MKKAMEASLKSFRDEEANRFKITSQSRINLLSITNNSNIPSFINGAVPRPNNNLPVPQVPNVPNTQNFQNNNLPVQNANNNLPVQNANNNPNQRPSSKVQNNKKKKRTLPRSEAENSNHQVKKAKTSQKNNTNPPK
jgi:hypothetical protein